MQNIPKTNTQPKLFKTKCDDKVDSYTFSWFWMWIWIRLFPKQGRWSLQLIRKGQHSPSHSANWGERLWSLSKIKKWDDSAISAFFIYEESWNRDCRLTLLTLCTFSSLKTQSCKRKSPTMFHFLPRTAMLTMVANVKIHQTNARNICKFMTMPDNPS